MRVKNRAIAPNMAAEKPTKIKKRLMIRRNNNMKQSSNWTLDQIIHQGRLRQEEWLFLSRPADGQVYVNAIDMKLLIR
jgi:hypothetical protein